MESRAAHTHPKNTQVPPRDINANKNGSLLNLSNLLYWVKKGEKIIVGVISGYGQDTLAGASYTCYIEYHPLDQYIFAYSKGEPLRLETLTLFRTAQNPTIYTLFRATPSMFSNNTNFSTETHVPTPRFPPVPYACAQPYHPGSSSHILVEDFWVEIAMDCFVLIRFHQKVYDPGVVCF